MSDFNPGNGYRRAEESEAFPAGTYVLREQIIGQRGYEQIWVREEPVPPLPTEPHTSIKVTWRSDLAVPNPEDDEFVLRVSTARGGLRWWRKRGPYMPEWVESSITGFEVLASPRNAYHWRRIDFNGRERCTCTIGESHDEDGTIWGQHAERIRRETVKAVLDTLPIWMHSEDWWVAIAREFGVEL